MKRLKADIIQYLESRNIPYRNKNKVEINLSMNYSISVVSYIPGRTKHDDYELEYCGNFGSVEQFIEKFAIRQVSDIEKIDPELMQTMFHLSNVDMWCLLYPSENILVFSKLQDNFFVRNYKNDLCHILSTPLKTPQDFRDYTYSYFSKEPV